ncbi:MAG: hypothetical protein U0R44_02320 [Candidatus Micrarchaeia archaeon]
MSLSPRNLFVIGIAVFLFVAGCTALQAPPSNKGAVCGNSVVEGSEQCEKGVSCKDASLVCSGCRCINPAGIPKQNISCAANARNVSSGMLNLFDNSSMLCKDDCRAIDPKSVCDPVSCTCASSCAINAFGALAGGKNVTNLTSNFSSSGLICKDDCKNISPAAICDAKNCVCRLPPPPIPLSCSGNSMIASFTGINVFNPATMVCRDDCAATDPNLRCDATCICVPKKTNVFCAANTNTVNAGKPNGFNAAANICKDDCKNVDPLMKCDAATCTCKKPGPVSCIGNSFVFALTGGSDYNPFGGLACKDDCKAFDKDLVCDPLSCICDYPPNKTVDTLPCATNTLFDMYAENGSIYDPAKYRCEDNCKEIDPSLYCDAKSCLCYKPTVEGGLSCAQNTRPTTGHTYEKAPPGTQCRDDCASAFGSAYECNPIACQCIPTGTPPREVSCSAHTTPQSFFDVFYDITDPTTFVAGRSICKDDCSSRGEGYQCDPTSCVCKPPVREASCVDRSYDSIGNGSIKPIQSGQMCKDDCKELDPNLVCDAQSCVCKVKVENGTSCSGNSLEGDYGNTVKYTPGTMCKDDCDYFYGSDYKCDGSSCTCKPKTVNESLSCADNTHGGTTVEKLPSGLQCKDDCERLGSGYGCEATSCTCVKRYESQSCAANSIFQESTGEGFIPSGGICKDDCKVLDPALTCDAKSCTCRASVVPGEPVSCAVNRLVGDNNPLAYDPKSMQCKDDCEKNWAPGSKCDAQTCKCEDPPTIPTEVNCAGNSIVSDFVGKSGFDPSKQICKDNCKELNPSFVCDKQSCTCTPRIVPKELYCADNSLYSSPFIGGTNEFDPKATSCKDNCQELEKLAGTDLECDAKTCTCKKADTLSCFQNSFLYGFTGGYLGSPAAQSGFAQGMQCKDDCKRGNPESSCDPVKCVCVVPERSVSCADRTGSVLPDLGISSAVPSGYSCKDDCSRLGTGYVCDAQDCRCSKVNETTGVSCASRRYGTTMEKLPAGALCKDDCQSLGSGYTCDAASCSCKGPQTAGVCGDGVILSPEQCDLGSYATNKCPQGTYCKDCACKKIETTPVCGDGKISSPGEDCDNGDVKTNLCQPGYSCKLCKCVPSTSIAQCGDGIVTPPEECDHGNTFTAECPNGNLCSSCRCRTPTGVVTHNVCDDVHGACVSVNGSGTNECSSDSDCVQPSTQVCGNGVREGTEQCDGSSAGCSSGQSCTSQCRCATPTGTPYHYECDFAHGACTKVDGAGTTNCAKDSDCVPPVVNCPSYCSGQGFSQSLGSSYTSGAQCQSAAQESASQCTTKCVYSKFYSTSNQAGTTTCCCKQVKTFACSDCPGEHPVCPDPNVICPANQP